MTSQTAQGENITTELQSTEMGSFIIKNKGLLIAVVACSLAAILGYGIKTHFDGKAEKEAANAFYSYESKTLKNYNDGKTDAAGLVVEFELLKSSYSAKSATFSSGLITFDALFSKGDYPQALKVLDGITGQNSFQVYFIGLRKAAILEQTGQLDKAISELKSLITSDLGLKSGKINLDLGRIYFAKGDKAQAKTHFEKVKSLNTQATFKSVADYFLQKL